jgi:hypothetical protein
MSSKLNKTDRAKYDRLMRGFTKNPDEYQVKLIQFSEDMDDKYGKHMPEIKGFNKGGVAKKKMMRGGMAAKTAPKRMRGGGMAKMASKKKMMRGGMAKKK